MRSRTGCLTCRQRKLKCDEIKPVCGQCRKANRTCHPSSGVVFRHHQNASMNGGNGEGIDGEDSLKGFYAYKNTFGADNIWVDVPKHVTFVTDTEAFDDSPTSTHAPSDPRKHVREGHRTRSSSDTFHTPPHLNTSNIMNHHHDWLAHASPQHFAVPPPPLRIETLSAAAAHDNPSYYPTSAMSDSALMQRPYHIDIPSSLQQVQQMPTPPVSDPREYQPAIVGSPNGYDHHRSMSPASAMPLHRSMSFNPNDMRHSSPVISATRVEFAVPPPMPAVTSNAEQLLVHEPTPSIANHSAGPLGTPNISSYTPQSMSAVLVGKKRGYEASIDSDPSGEVAERDLESAVLIRHFVENAGQWLDLFDIGKYFTEHLPARLTGNALLRSAVLAFAAKQLGRSAGSIAVSGVCSRPGKTEQLHGATSSSWLYRAQQYNEQAISLLANALREENEAAGNSPITHREGSEFSGHRQKRRRLSFQRSASTRNPDDLLVASAILCVYEFIDGAGPEFTSHLDGARTLLNVRDGLQHQRVHQRTPSGGIVFAQPLFSRSRRAAFWSVARQDFTAAFINERPTRLNCDDLTLWRNAGLLLDDSGNLQLRAKVLPNTVDPEDTARDDSVSHSLTYLLCRIVNYISASDALAVGQQQFETIPEDEALLFNSGSPNPAAHQRILGDRWDTLHRQLELWHCALPETYKPSARIGVTPESEEAFAEVWYASPKRASVMQHYHMAKILLLINKPALNTFAIGSHRLKSYHSIDAEIRYHSHEICGIGISNPGASARVHMLQPLFVAGQCLHDLAERNAILEMLRNIESDLGFASNSRVNTLLQDWGWAQGAV